MNAKSLLGMLAATGMGGMNRRSGFGLPMGGGMGSLLGGFAGASMLGRGRGGFGKMAGMGLLAALAYKAYQKHVGSQTAATTPPSDPKLDQAADAAESAVGNEDALLMVRAMIAAANADGRVDADERQRILGHLDDAGATTEDRQFVQRELGAPPSVETLARDAHTPELRLNLYAAALLALTVDTDAERSFLKYLADRLGLTREQVEAAHRDVGLPHPAG